MWWFFLFQLFLGATAGRTAYEKTGYFWHITDLHYDGHINSNIEARKGCWRPDYEGGKGKSSRKPMGRYGDYSCDSTWELIESAAAMMSRQNDVDFVLWTGDGLSHATRHLSEERQLEIIKNITDLLSRIFKSQFVFPAIGHDDPNKHEMLSEMWSRWLPDDSKILFGKTGYYIIERKMRQLQIIVLNTNLMRRHENDQEAREQWKWLEKVLTKFQTHDKTVYIIGHTPPGSNERQTKHHNFNHMTYSDYHNKKYLKIIRKYAGIIAGQFFGHFHSDTFRVMYDENKGKPISWTMIAPSITPKRSSEGPNNPGLRLYKFDQDTGQVFDYTQFYLDLSRLNANSNRNAEWAVEYTFSTYYSINEINAVTLHNLADKLTQNYLQDNSVFNKYYKANSVSINNNAADCDAACAHTHYCSITRLDYTEFHQCLQTTHNSLSTSGSALRIPKLPMVLFMSTTAHIIALMKWLT